MHVQVPCGWKAQSARARPTPDPSFCSKTSLPNPPGAAYDLAFAYLGDNTAGRPGDVVLRRPLHCALVDEVDSLLVGAWGWFERLLVVSFGRVFVCRRVGWAAIVGRGRWRAGRSPHLHGTHCSRSRLPASPAPSGVGFPPPCRPGRHPIHHLPPPHGSGPGGPGRALAPGGAGAPLRGCSSWAAGRLLQGRARPSRREMGSVLSLQSMCLLGSLAGHLQQQLCRPGLDRNPAALLQVARQLECRVAASEALTDEEWKAMEATVGGCPACLSLLAGCLRGAAADCGCAACLPWGLRPQPPPALPTHAPCPLHSRVPSILSAVRGPHPALLVQRYHDGPRPGRRSGDPGWVSGLSTAGMLACILLLLLLLQVVPTPLAVLSQRPAPLHSPPQWTAAWRRC